MVPKKANYFSHLDGLSCVYKISCILIATRVTYLCIRGGSNHLRAFWRLTVSDDSDGCATYIAASSGVWDQQRTVTIVQVMMRSSIDQCTEQPS
jgi:hypothetical protein